MPSIDPYFSSTDYSDNTFPKSNCSTNTNPISIEEAHDLLSKYASDLNMLTKDLYDFQNRVSRSPELSQILDSNTLQVYDTFVYHQLEGIANFIKKQADLLAMDTEMNEIYGPPEMFGMSFPQDHIEVDDIWG